MPDNYLQKPFVVDCIHRRQIVEEFVGSAGPIPFLCSEEPEVVSETFRGSMVAKPYLDVALVWV